MVEIITSTVLLEVTDIKLFCATINLLASTTFNDVPMGTMALVIILAVVVPLVIETVIVAWVELVFDTNNPITVDCIPAVVGL